MPEDTELQTEATPVETETEATTASTELAPGFHVKVDGVSHGCYPTMEDAAAFATGHIAHNGLDYEIVEVG